MAPTVNQTKINDDASATSSKGCAETQYAVNCRGGGYNGGLVEMDNEEYAASSFWKPSHTAYAYELSDEDECEAPKKEAPTTEATEQAPTALAPAARVVHSVDKETAETQYAKNARGGGYNGGLVEMDNTDYAASSFWKPTHNAYAYDLSDEDI